uniref:Secreted protein n=1 Tax=Paramormyrops kingsleyae TaxID=1676925 RepID=A0A3B3RJ41_9TELE
MSFTTRTLIVAVPVFAGFPPSNAVSTSWIMACFSLSKAFCSTNSADTLCSPSLCISRVKWSRGTSIV